MSKYEEVTIPEEEGQIGVTARIEDHGLVLTFFSAEEGFMTQVAIRKHELKKGLVNVCPMLHNMAESFKKILSLVRNPDGSRKEL